MKKIAVIVGSLRKESFNRKMAKALIALAPESLKFEIIEIGALPLYDQDLEDNPPTTWTQFRERLPEFDGVLFVTPEYNRSVPGVLKNAIDVGSRPYGKNVWDGKTWCRSQCFNWSDRRIWGKPSPPSVSSVS